MIISQFLPTGVGHEDNLSFSRKIGFFLQSTAVRYYKRGLFYQTHQIQIVNWPDHNHISQIVIKAKLCNAVIHIRTADAFISEVRTSLSLVVVVT